MCIPSFVIRNQRINIPRKLLKFYKKSIPSLSNREYYCTNVALNSNRIPRWSLVEKFCKQIHNSRAFSSKPQGTSDCNGSTLTKEQAYDLANKLTKEDRDTLITVLKECKSKEDKAGYEGQLAALRWRSKFGRPSKIPSLGDVDPTGSYCAVPDDWLIQKYVENVPEPSNKDLLLVAITNAIPFIGFGFLDNFIMIVAGDQIEMILNRKFPITTMTAAALGNTVSDIIGIGSVQYVEMFAQKIGFQPPKLTPIQLDLPKTRRAANMGRVIGVTCGCILGMTPIPIFAFFHDSS